MLSTAPGLPDKDFTTPYRLENIYQDKLLAKYITALK